eukprot:CAMPEP_0198249520 /NCGR_PEP_ID=MMETSP1447-20131203/1023_1 /TAXON_ID=420782 /ORGANISM="Chaetoceros dichaeta, Strain CCMP1751" /LENGTH=791 /DNA_ID=CAMNT_0043934179 /DNA_START=43 /DNA_END=2418 /DNA_ORIENTATION=+
MRFHRLALSTVALVALSSFQGYNGFAYADEVEDTSASVDAAAEPVEKFDFQADVSRVLDIVVNSLYQNKDVFLRELISNASDAIDKARFLAIQKPEVLSEKSELEVRISYDDEARTLTVCDSGIGMTKAELIANLGTVAQSGTTKFMDALAEGAADVNQIGMFGVGFYSSYLVADKVTVATKHPNDPIQHIWSSKNGESSFTIGEDSRGNSLGRGTEITLYLKEDAEEYADFGRLQSMVNHYSEFIQHPIFIRKTEIMEVPDEDAEAEADEEVSKEDDLDVSEDDGDEDGEDETPQKMKEVTTHSWEKANADAALWNRPKEEISDDDYQEFYKLISKDYANATSWSHFDAEGNINFKSLVYLPTELPANLKSGDYNTYKNSIKLYVRKVLISDEFELLPKYLSFVKGVVDSEDLPLNVNRETLQESKILSIVGKKVTRKVLDLIKKFSEEFEKESDEAEIDEDGNVIEPEDGADKKTDPYLEWYEKFNPSLKMGVMDDESNKKRLVKLLRVKTSKSNGEWKSFADYVSDMKDYQDEIYYIPGTSIKEVEGSPFMEKFIEKDLEVVYFLDAVDEYMIERLREFDGKKFSIITSESVKFGDADEDLQKRVNAAYNEKFMPLTKFLNKFYGKAVSRALVSKRLGKVPAVVSSGQFGNSANMERIIRAQVFAHGQDDNQVKGMRTLEVNPRHPFIEKLLGEIPEDDAEVSQEMKDFLWSLLDTALLNGGYTIYDAKAFSNRMTRMLKSQFDVDSLDLLPEIEPKEEEDVPPVPMDGDGINLDDFAGNLDDFGDDF